MFTYVQIFRPNEETFNGYAAFEFGEGILSLAFMTGLSKTVRVKIPLAEISNLSEDPDIKNQIEFDYDGKHFVFLNSGYGVSNFLKENLIAAFA
ncbi:hypothetical protein [Companilactobacillus zhongbaensis]|uniref:hypothetical protein n=1 Tax=Companilactobacillus zhongbaensis TaxID=2486009 RepID=UPI000F76A28D|nr:hypothetical protein [Companilactobacillus zhongbaensis]